MDNPINANPEPTRSPATLVLERALWVASIDGIGEVLAEVDEAKIRELSLAADKTWGESFADVGDGDFVVVDVAFGVGVGDFVEVDCDADEEGDGSGVGVGVGSTITSQLELADSGVGEQVFQLMLPSE